MGVHEGRGQLAKAMKDLSQRWLEARGQWNDAQSKQFEEQHLMAIEADLRNAVGAMDQMASLLSQIQRDCRPD